MKSRNIIDRVRVVSPTSCVRISFCGPQMKRNQKILRTPMHGGGKVKNWLAHNNTNLSYVYSIWWCVLSPVSTGSIYVEQVTQGFQLVATITHHPLRYCHPSSTIHHSPFTIHHTPIQLLKWKSSSFSDTLFRKQSLLITLIHLLSLQPLHTYQ